MISLLLAAALAAPDDLAIIDPTDPTPYEATWSRIQEGPRGCWEVVGTASWRWDAGPMGYSHGDAAFVARFEDGVWRDVITRSLGEVQKERRGPAQRVFDHDEVKVMPLVGRRNRTDLDEDKDGVGDHVLTYALDRLGREVEYSDLRPNEAGTDIILSRTIPFENGRQQAKMDVLFAQGSLLPHHMSIAFPESFTVPSFRLAKVRDAKATIRARVLGGDVFPEAESTTFDVSVLGFQGSGAQTVRYTSFRRCGGVYSTEQAPLSR